MNFRLASEPVPVTIISGYLGSGKTTLLNRILHENGGRRIAVIQNEFGEIGIDGDLVLNVQDALVELTNGCLCCSVRDELVEVLEDLLDRKDVLDHIVIETTGLAEPGAIVTTILLHPDMGEEFRIDGVVTLVDAAHIHRQLENSSEAREQIAFADLILLNKTDLVSPGTLDSLEQGLRNINEVAEITRTKNALADPEEILDIGGFDLTRISLGSTSPNGQTLELIHDDHTHDHEIQSISLRFEGAIDFDRFDKWIGALLEENSENLYRMKGILAIAHQPRRFVFQGVHALYNWRYGETWEDGHRENKVVFIGKNLSREALENGMESCLATQSLSN